MVTICTTSGHYMYRQLNIHKFCPHSVFMSFVWIWEQTAIISLHSINWLEATVFSESQSESFNTVQMNFSLQMINMQSHDPHNLLRDYMWCYIVWQTPNNNTRIGRPCKLSLFPIWIWTQASNLSECRAPCMDKLSPSCNIEALTVVFLKIRLLGCDAVSMGKWLAGP